MADSSDTFKTMCMGIAIFVGGMIAVIILMKYLNPPASTVRAETPAPILPLAPFSSKQLEKLNETVSNMQPKGEFFTRALNIDDKVHMYRCQREGGLQYTKVDILNAGPNNVYFSVNNSDMPEAPLGVGQTIPIDFNNRAAIDKIYFRCDKGETALVYLYIVK